MTYIITFLLLCCSALFSGLTLGLMSLNTHELKRKMDLHDKYAKKIYPIRKRGNLLLTTLLLGNVAVNAALAIFLGTIAAGLVAGIVSTALIFVFGEIVPQAVISRYAMAFGAKTAWIVKILIVVLLPLTFPIAWILDKTLGEEMPSVYSRNELIKVIQEHGSSKHSDLDTDEERITRGALTFSNKTAVDVMTPKTVVKILDAKVKITVKLIKELRDSGHSKFPVYLSSENNIVGILYLHDLLGKEIKGKTIEKFMKKPAVEVVSTVPLDDILNRFIKEHRHLFIVRDEFGGFEGVISVEDILEVIIGTQIVDEFDKVIDLRALARKKAVGKKKARKS